jgi:hypothetical protein
MDIAMFLWMVIAAFLGTMGAIIFYTVWDKAYGEYREYKDSKNNVRR